MQRLRCKIYILWIYLNYSRTQINNKVYKNETCPTEKMQDVRDPYLVFHIHMHIYKIQKWGFV